MKYENMSDRDLLDVYEQAKDEEAKIHEARIHHSFISNKQGRGNVGNLKHDLQAILSEMNNRKLHPK